MDALDGLSDGLRAQLDDALEVRRLLGGEAIFSEGDDGDAAYLIDDDEVEVRRGDTVLARLGPGELLGEMTLLDRSPRGASAIAGAAGVTLRRLTADAFDALIDASDDGGAEVYRSLLAASYSRLGAMNRYFSATCRAGALASAADEQTAIPALLALIAEVVGAPASLVEVNLHTDELEALETTGEPGAEWPADDPLTRALVAAEPGEVELERVGEAPAIVRRLAAGEGQPCGLLVVGEAPFPLADRLLVETVAALVGLVVARRRAATEAANRKRLTRARETRLMERGL